MVRGADPTSSSTGQGDRSAARDDAALVRELCAWYRRARRALPWRATRDPYAIWISEAMLQQTRVETVVPYWERFLARFPTVADLARAGEDEVLAAWSGLGYYRRARALREAARAVCERFGGVLPTSARELATLPGIGPYTAGAIASIAHDLPEPLVDGNVARVLCRLFAVEGDPASGAVRALLWERAGELVRRARSPGEWNQALMELGATVCTPREPGCARCPLAARCRARAAGRTAELPATAPRAEPLAVELVVHLIERSDGRVLLERRPPGGRMADMWQLPTGELPGPGGATSGLFPPAPVLRASGEEHVATVRHSITRHRIRAEVRRARIAGRVVGARFGWFGCDELEGLALTGMTRKALRAARVDAGSRPKGAKGGRPR